MKKDGCGGESRLVKHLFPREHFRDIVEVDSGKGGPV